MSVPKITLSLIEPYISPNTYTALKSSCNDSLLDQLSNSRGVNRIYKDVNVNVRIDWHRDEKDIIRGLFMRIYGSHFIEAFIINDDGYKRELNINPHDTFEFSRSLIDLSDAQKLFAIINLKTHEEVIAFKLDNFKNPEKIKEFFSNHQDMLPEPIKEKIFPKLSLNPSHSEENSEGQSCLIIALIVIIVGTAIVSTKYFSSRVAK